MYIFPIICFFIIFVAVNMLIMKIKTIEICTVKTVSSLLGVSNSTASRKIELARCALDKPKPKVISMKEFCQYFGIS